MAVFDPPIKDVQGVNPIGWSHAAEVPSSFASTLATSIKGVGDLIGQGVKAADELVKQSIDRTAGEEIEPIRDDYISKLAGADFSQKLGYVGSPDTPEGTGAPTRNTLMSEGFDPSSNAPEDLKQNLKSLGTLEAARANGKISLTDYYGRLVSAAKELRSRYPVGYRDYIDKEISKITGVDPANAYLHSIMGDINANISNTQAEKNRILGQLASNVGLDPINVPKWYAAVSAGTISPAEGLSKLGPLEAVDVQFKRDHQAFQTAEMTDKFLAVKAKQSFQTYVSDKVGADFRGDIELKGLTPIRLEQIAQDDLSGKMKMSDEQRIQLKDELRARMVSTSKQLYAKLNETTPDRPKPMKTYLGEEGTKMINDSLEPYKMVLDAIENKDYGTLVRNIKMIDAANSDIAKKLYDKPELRFFLGTSDAIKKYGGGEQAAGQFFSTNLGVKLSTELADYIKQTKAELALPKSSGNQGAIGVTGLSDFIDKYQRKEKDLGISTPQSYEEVSSLIDARDNRPSLLNQSTNKALKEGIVEKFFGPDNWGVLNKIKPDLKDKFGNTIPGQESWFYRFTRPDVVQQVNQLGPEHQKMYHDWIQKSYEDIFSNNIKAIARAPLSTTSLGKSSASGYAVGWDNNKNIFYVREKSGNTPALQDDVAKLNKGIAGLRASYQGQGFDETAVTAKVLESLRSNFDDRLHTINGLPEAFRQTLELEYKKKVEEERLKKETQKKYKPE